MKLLQRAKRRARLRRDVDAPIKSELARLRRTLAHDDQAMAVCDDLQKLLDAGWTQRVCNARPARVADLRPEWKGKLPPERD